MEFTTGELMFYVGIAGMILSSISAIIAYFMLKDGKKKLNVKLMQEYGELNR